MFSVVHKSNFPNKDDAVGEINENGKKTHFTGRHLFLSLLLLRIVNVFLVRTSFVPDEYWQSLEVAHHSVFGYGYLTWEWKYGLRSYAYPSVFATLYHLLKFLRLDYTVLLVTVPRLMQASLSALGDWFLYSFAKEHFGNTVANLTLFSCVTSWFWWYCATRTIINTLECTALCVGLYYHPWQGSGDRYKSMIYELIAIVICVTRPTAAVIWIPLALRHLYVSRKTAVLLSYMFWSIVALTLSTLLDRFYYGEWVSVHWNFFTFNVLKNLGIHYGANAWHWYLTQGLFVVLGPQVLFFAYGVVTNEAKKSIQAYRICRCLLALFIFSVFTYSLIAHKEFRFILHLVPIASIFSGYGLFQLSSSVRKYAMLFLVFFNLPIALYIGLVHQSGSLAVTNHLKILMDQSCDPKCSGGVLYLTPCHATPLYSHLHLNVTARILECPPNLQGLENYQDEADRFYLDPVAWLEKNVFSDDIAGDIKFNWIVIFDHLHEQLQTYDRLIRQYELCRTEFHSHFPEGRTGRYIHILCHK